MVHKARVLSLLIGATLLGGLTGCDDNDDNNNQNVTPPAANKKALVYGHRGAAGYLPDHTIEGYIRGMALGADFVEPDLVMTSDGFLVCRHEPNIGGTTNVADHPEFANRKTTKIVDGAEVKDDWFVSDFTLAEIKTLKARQPLPLERSTAYDGLYEIPTFEEMIKAVQAENTRLGKKVGIIPEIKHSTFHATTFKDKFPANYFEDKVVSILNQYGYSKKTDPAIIQSFEVSNLKYLNGKTDVRLVQLIDGKGANLDGTTQYAIPYDQVAQGITNAPALTSKEGLAEIAKYADIIGPWKNYIVGSKGVDKDGDGKADDINGDGLVDERDRTLATPTDLIKDAHAAGLEVVPYTFRDEPRRLASDYKNDPKAEYKKFYDLGVDGVFTDFVDTAVAARDSK